MSTRYARQLVLPEIGAAGQERLARASVLVVGAGGLGCPVLQYLAAAGVGRLILIDPDRVEESNLHRQPLYRMSDIGMLKVEAASAALRALNPDAAVSAHAERLTPANVMAYVSSADLAIDAADSFAVTYILSDACRCAGKYLVSASVLGWSGYAGVFCGQAPSYRAVFPELPQRAGSCSENGVLGSAVGILGSLQAQLALSVLLGMHERVAGRIVTLQLRELRFGGFSFTGAVEPEPCWPQFIDLSAVADEDTVVDLREPEEAPALPAAHAIRRNAESFERATVTLPREQRIVLCCRTGLRAWRAARALQRQGYQRLALVALGP